MLREKMYFNDLLYRIENLTLYRSIKEDVVIQSLVKLATAISTQSGGIADLTSEYRVFVERLLVIAERQGYSGNILGKHVLNLFVKDENSFTVLCETVDNFKNFSIYKYALNDIKTLKFLMEFDVKNICENLGQNEDVYKYNPVTVRDFALTEQLSYIKSTEDLLEFLILTYKMQGSGVLGQYENFKISDKGELVGIQSATKAKISEIMGCREQKDKIISNTDSFLKGGKAKNCLLYGARNSGKSTLLNALANKYSQTKLKIVDISIDKIKFIPDLIQTLAKRNGYFIFMIDGLSLNDFTQNYYYLKVLLGLGLENKPKNILLYATSDDKELAIKFELGINFSDHTEAQYMEFVLDFAKKENLSIGTDFLKQQAKEWIKKNPALSYENARGFIEGVVFELKNY